MSATPGYGLAKARLHLVLGIAQLPETMRMVDRRNRAGAISVGEREGCFSMNRADPDVPCA